MKYLSWIAAAAAALVLVVLVMTAQSGPTTWRTTVRYLFQEGFKVDSGTVDMSSATSIDLGTGEVGTTELAASSVTFAKQAHVTIGAIPAATCTAGQIHIDTDETTDTNCDTTADNSLCLCTADDTWTALENN